MKTGSKNRSIETFILLSVFIFLFSLTFISAEKVQIQQTNGILISDANQRYISQGENHTFDFHLSRLSDGTLINDTDVYCEFALYDNNGELLINDNLNFNNDTTSNWDIEISGEHFDDLGIYSYIVQCEDEIGKIGGVRALEIEVTPGGKGGNENTIFFIFIVILLYGITFFGFFGKNIPMTILGGMALLFLGVYLINEGIIIFRDTITLYISYLTIGVGGITAFWALLEQFDVI